MLFCLVVSVLGGTFQFGWSVSVLNLPYKSVQAFINETYSKRNGKDIPDSELELIWAITNGVVPLGGIFGGGFSGFAADFFGRFPYILKIITSHIILTKTHVIYDF